MEQTVGDTVEALGSGIGFDVLMFIVGGGVLIALLLGARFVLEVVPMSRSRRDAMRRASPALGLLFGVVYTLFGVRSIFSGHPTEQALIAVLLLAAVLAASWFALLDLIAGVVLKAGRVCRVGDTVRIGDLEGRVVNMGQRVMTLETTHGEEAVLPYGKIARESVLRSPVLDGLALHVFSLKTKKDVPIASVKQAVRERALRSHWASVVRDPEIVGLGDQKFEITVYALHSDYAADIETAIRSAGIFET